MSDNSSIASENTFNLTDTELLEEIEVQIDDVSSRLSSLGIPCWYPDSVLLRLVVYRRTMVNWDFCCRLRCRWLTCYTRPPWWPSKWKSWRREVHLTCSFWRRGEICWREDIMPTSRQPRTADGCRSALFDRTYAGRSPTCMQLIKYALKYSRYRSKITWLLVLFRRHSCMV